MKSATQNQCILQYECWNHSGKKTILEAVSRLPLVAEDAKLGNDWGMRVKTVFRIYDAGGQIATLTKDLANADKRIWDILEQAGEGKVRSYRRRILDKVTLHVNKEKRTRLKKKILEYSLQYMHNILAKRSSDPVAVEPYSGPFRMMERHEVLELAQRIEKANALHIFVFTPNALCADKNDIVTAALV